MPLRPEFAAAADGGENVDAAAGHPAGAVCSGVSRNLRNLEAAIGGEQGRVCAVSLEVLRHEHEVRDFGAVLRSRFVLRDRHPIGVEPGRRRFDLLRTAVVANQIEARGRDEIGVGEEEAVIDPARATETDGAEAGKFDLLLRPSSIPECEAIETAADVVQGRVQQIVAGRPHLVQRYPLFGLEENLEVSFALQEIIEIDGEQSILGIGRARRCPSQYARREASGP